MQVTTSPAALPGSCYLCGNASREQYIDTGISVEFHGAMYLCDVCVTEMAGLLGFVTPEGARELTDKIEHLNSEMFAAITRAAGLERAHLGLLDAGYCPDPVAHVHPDNHPPVGEVPAGSGASNVADAAGSSEREDDVAAGEGTPAESLHDEGVAVVHSDVGGAGGFTFDL